MYSWFFKAKIGVTLGGLLFDIIYLVKKALFYYLFIKMFYQGAIFNLVTPLLIIEMDGLLMDSLMSHINIISEVKPFSSEITLPWLQFLKHTHSKFGSLASSLDFLYS